MGKKTVMMREQKQRNWRQVSEVRSLWVQAEEPERRQQLSLVQREQEAEKSNMTSFEAV